MPSPPPPAFSCPSGLNSKILSSEGPSEVPSPLTPQSLKLTVSVYWLYGTWYLKVLCAIVVPWWWMLPLLRTVVPGPSSALFTAEFPAHRPMPPAAEWSMNDQGRARGVTEWEKAQEGQRGGKGSMCSNKSIQWGTERYGTDQIDFLTFREACC